MRHVGRLCRQARLLEVTCVSEVDSELRGDMRGVETRLDLEGVWAPKSESWNISAFPFRPCPWPTSLGCCPGKGDRWEEGGHMGPKPGLEPGTHHMVGGNAPNSIFLEHLEGEGS